MLKSFWPLWLLAGALCLCLMAVAWLHYEVQEGAEAVWALQSVNEANAKVLQGIQESQKKQETALLNWDERQQQLTRAARTKAKTVREARKNENFTIWADQPLPADAYSVFQSTGTTH